MKQIVKSAQVLETQHVVPDVLVPADNLLPQAYARAALRDYTDVPCQLDEPECDYCEESGHAKANCYTKRRQLRSCFSCGLEGHISRNCPRKRSAEIDDPHETPRRSHAVSKCQFCGNGFHLIAQCVEFQQRCMACIWCGSLEHESFWCEHKPTFGSGNGRPPVGVRSTVNAPHLHSSMTARLESDLVASYKVPITVGSVVVNALVDTGSSVSMATSGILILDSVPGLYNQLRPSSVAAVTSVSGTNVNVVSEVIIPLEIGPLVSSPHRVIIVRRV